MSRPDRPREDTPFHRFAWDGFSFDVPAAWNLSFYHFAKKSAQLRMEDDEVVRLEFEWTRLQDAVSVDTIRERYTEKTGKISEVAKKTFAIGDLPDGWAAFVYTMPDGRFMAMAIVLASGGRFLGFVRMHFGEKSRPEAIDVTASLARSFALHEGDLVPWEVYDMKAEVSRNFTLVSTSFEAGRKLLVFQRKMTKLYLWQFSLADVALRGRSLQEWAAAFLGTFRPIKGVDFVPDGGGVKALKKGRYPLGHYDEIGRWCFRYKIGCAHIPERNVIALWVYNYRSDTDLAQLRGSLSELPLV